MGKLVRRTLEGDSTVLEWSADDADSVRAAAETMQREVADADVVILTMPMGGG